MKSEELLSILLRVDRSRDAEDAVDEFEAVQDGQVDWHPVGSKFNNRGVIEVAANTGRALVERVTNAIDAVLESEYISHGGHPDCRSPREAARAWLNAPEEGLSALTPRERQKLADRITVTMCPGDGEGHRCVEIVDTGIGLSRLEMPLTILSLNESNKLQKLYLAGTYGQGGSASLQASKITLIASKKRGSSEVAFTVIRFQDLPPDQYKTGHYVYLRVGERVLGAAAPDEAVFPTGTRCKHFGYDLAAFGSPIGPRSLYGLLQQVLFDPVTPIWFDNRVHKYRRVIKGSRNALNGASDEGDDRSGSAKVVHQGKMFHASLGEYGRVGIEYWVLQAPDKAKKRPIESYVDPRKPIIMTLNGQNQGEMPVSLVRRDAELPYLSHRLICHLDCNSLSRLALRKLLVSNREEARATDVYRLIERELVEALRADDELARLNAEAKESSLQERDESATEAMRQEVARLLRLQGFEVSTAAGVVAGKGGAGGQPQGGKRPPKKPLPIQINDPPTFVRIVWPDDEPIAVYPNQRRYIRIETDAQSRYHDPLKPEQSRFNFVATGEGLRVAGTTALAGGRMRVVLECAEGAEVGQVSEFRIELVRPSLALLSDVRGVEVIEQPPAKEGKQRLVMPQFEVRPVYPETDGWLQLGWPDEIGAVASEAAREGGILIVHYNAAFPRYVQMLQKFERRDASLAASFTRRYEVWLAVHALILDESKTSHSAETEGALSEEILEAFERSECCRMGIVAAMFAAREVQAGGMGDE